MPTWHNYLLNINKHHSNDTMFYPIIYFKRKKYAAFLTIVKSYNAWDLLILGKLWKITFHSPSWEWQIVRWGKLDCNVWLILY